MKKAISRLLPASGGVSELRLRPAEASMFSQLEKLEPRVLLSAETPAVLADLFEDDAAVVVTAGADLAASNSNETAAELVALVLRSGAAGSEVG